MTPMPTLTKRARILAALRKGAQTCADVEVDLDFELSRHHIAGHLSGLLREGKIRKTGEHRSLSASASRPAYRYEVNE